MARPRTHLVVSCALGFMLWRRTGKLLAAFAPLLGGFLVDADHLIDYGLYQRRGGGRPIYLLLHGWEYAPLLWWFERGHRHTTGGGVTLGFVSHLLIDQMTNGVSGPWHYFLIFRALHGFSRSLWRRSSSPPSDWRRVPLRKAWHWF